MHPMLQAISMYLLYCQVDPMFFLKTLKIKVSVVAPNTSTRLVLVLPVASLVRLMMKALSEEALCPFVDTTRATRRSRQ